MKARIKAVEDKKNIRVYCPFLKETLIAENQKAIPISRPTDVKAPPDQWLVLYHIREPRETLVFSLVSNFQSKRSFFNIEK